MNETAWGGISDRPIETGVSAVIDPVTGEVTEEQEEEERADPHAIDVNTMSTADFMALADWQWTIVLQQIVAEIGAVQRRRGELAPFYYEYKGLQEKERSFTSMKSAVQTLLRTGREG
jgi:hypothetical protein